MRRHDPHGLDMLKSHQLPHGWLVLPRFPREGNGPCIRAFVYSCTQQSKVTRACLVPCRRSTGRVFVRPAALPQPVSPAPVRALPCSARHPHAGAPGGPACPRSLWLHTHSPTAPPVQCYGGYPRLHLLRPAPCPTDSLTVPCRLIEPPSPIHGLVVVCATDCGGGCSCGACASAGVDVRRCGGATAAGRQTGSAVQLPVDERHIRTVPADDAAAAHVPTTTAAAAYVPAAAAAGASDRRACVLASAGASVAPVPMTWGRAIWRDAFGARTSSSGMAPSLPAMDLGRCRCARCVLRFLQHQTALSQAPVVSPRRPTCNGPSKCTYGMRRHAFCSPDHRRDSVPLRGQRCVRCRSCTT